MERVDYIAKTDGRLTVSGAPAGCDADWLPGGLGPGRTALLSPGGGIDAATARCESTKNVPPLGLYNGRQMQFVAVVSPSPIDWHWVWLTVAAFLGGLLNAVAGGGSFLLFPAMLGMNMLPIQANATNTVALWPGQLTSIAAYREDIRKNLRLAFTMGLAGFLGGTGGAIVLLNTPQTTFLQLVPWLLLVAASIFAVSGPVSRCLERRKRSVAQTQGRLQLPVFLCTIVV